MFQGAVEGMQAGEGYRELLLARVAVGEAADLGKKTDKTLKFPPKRDDASGLRCAYGLAAGARSNGIRVCFLNVSDL